MPTTIISTNMNLPIPIPGVDPGPDYANDLNSCLTLVDAHTHSSGSGVQITPSGLNINADLALNGNNLTLIRSLRLQTQSAALVGATDLGCLYRTGVDLYYIDGSGNNIRITQSGAVSGASGTITGLPSGTASASFGSGVFVFQASTATGANIDGASFVFRNNTASSKGLTLAPPNAMGANYSLVLPSIPAALGPMTLDTSGNMGTVTYDQVGQAMTSTGANAIAATMNATGANAIAATMTITGVNSIFATSSDANFPGKSVKEAGQNVVVSSTNATNSLAIIRGAINSIGQVLFGEGFNSARNATGNYTINWTEAFGDTPAITTTCSSDACLIQIAAVSSTSAQLQVVTPAGAATDQTFHFIAIGQRA